MFKRMALLFSVIMLIAGLAGCGGQSSGNSGKSSSQSKSSSGSKTVTIAYPSWWDKWQKGLKKDFEAAHPGVTVKLVPVTANGGDIYSKMDMMMKSPKTSPDVVVEDTFMIDSDVSAGYLEPISDKLTKWNDWNNFVSVTKKSVKAVDNKTYGVPFSTDVQGLWYDKKLFKNAGLPVPFQPKSWQDVLNAAKKIKKSAGSKVTPLFMYSTKATGEQTSMRTFQVLYSGTGAKLYNFNKKKWVVNQKAMEQTFGFINKVYKQNLGPSLSMASNGKISNLLVNQYMPNNKVAMVMDGNWVPASWRKGGSHPWPSALKTWGFAAFPTENGQAPGHTSMSGGWALSIPKNASNKKLAWEFIKFASSEKQELHYALLQGDMAVRKDVSQNAKYLKQPISDYKKSAEILKYTHYRPSVDKYPSVSTLLQKAVESVAAGSATPQQAVKNYQTNLKRVVGKGNVIVK